MMPFFTTSESKAERRSRPEVAVRNFHSKAKALLFRRAAAAFLQPCLLDLGAGRGADAARYAFFASVTAVDRDEEALAELLWRCSAVRVVHTDMCHVRLGCVYDVVSSMFCAQYACGDEHSLHAFAQTVSEHLRAKGTHIGMAMDGDSVLRALAGVGRKCFTSWAELALIYSSDECELEVTIKSIAPEPKREPLLMWHAFRNAMESSGLRLIDHGMLDPGAEVADHELAAFSRLHRWWCFEKPAKVA